MASKREPTLADRFIARRFSARERIIHPTAMDQMQGAARNAHRFVFDEEATERVARVIIELPELLIREHQLARSPYDVAWIEYPSHVLWEAFRRERPELYAGKGERHRLTADHKVAYLIDHGRVNVVVGGTVERPDTQPHVAPLQYRLHTEFPIEEQLEVCRLISASRIGLDAFMWGSTYEHTSDETSRLLRGFNLVEPAPLNPAHPASGKLRAPGSLEDAAEGSVGELRNIIAFLLMLNRPSVTQFTGHPATRGWHKGKMVPYFSHDCVTVDLDAVRTISKVGTSEGDSVPRRRHEVRGHYCHDRTAHDYMKIARCVHNWLPHDNNWMPCQPSSPEEAYHWVCGTCGGKLWWRSSHERGDAGRGFVIREAYHVTD